MSRRYDEFDVSLRMLLAANNKTKTKTHTNNEKNVLFNTAGSPCPRKIQSAGH